MAKITTKKRIEGIRSKEKKTGWYDECLSARYVPKRYR